jgi:hypothetical protein
MITAVDCIFISIVTKKSSKSISLNISYQIELTLLKLFKNFGVQQKKQVHEIYTV